MQWMRGRYLVIAPNSLGDKKRHSVDENCLQGGMVSDFAVEASCQVLILGALGKVYRLACVLLLSVRTPCV